MVLAKSTLRGPLAPDHLPALAPAPHHIGHQSPLSTPPPSAPQFTEQLPGRGSYETRMTLCSMRFMRSQPPWRLKSQSRSLPTATLPEDDHWKVNWRSSRS